MALTSGVAASAGEDDRGVSLGDLAAGDEDFSRCPASLALSAWMAAKSLLATPRLFPASRNASFFESFGVAGACAALRGEGAEISPEV